MAASALSKDVTDVREGGRWSPAQRAKNDALYVLVCAVLAVTTRLPVSWLRAIGRVVGSLALVVAPSSRRIAEENVARAFPDLDAPHRRALVRRSYLELGTYLGEVVAALDPSRSPPTLPFAPGSREVLEAALAEGRGVVFASAHLGPWERVASSLVAAGFPLTTIAREAYDPRLTRIYDRLRGGRGIRAIYRGSPGSAAALLRTLRRGGLLGLPMDLASRVPSVVVPFLGAEASTPVGPARLALRTGAAVVVGTAAPDPQSPSRLCIRVTRIHVGATPDEVALTALLNDELSRRIRELPHAWVWMHPRWAGMLEHRCR